MLYTHQTPELVDSEFLRVNHIPDTEQYHKILNSYGPMSPDRTIFFLSTCRMIERLSALFNIDIVQDHIDNFRSFIKINLEEFRDDSAFYEPGVILTALVDSLAGEGVRHLIQTIFKQPFNSKIGVDIVNNSDIDIIVGEINKITLLPNIGIKLYHGGMTSGKMNLFTYMVEELRLICPVETILFDMVPDTLLLSHGSLATIQTNTLVTKGNTSVSPTSFRPITDINFNYEVDAKNLCNYTMISLG